MWPLAMWPCGRVVALQDELVELAAPPYFGVKAS